ncbi:MAG: hypothetical protein ACYS32_05435 [Planctomycetota bacterium]|jgi:hypothetical protein
MKFTFRLVLILVFLFGVSGCQTKSGIENTTLSQNNLPEAAHRTYAGYVRAIHAGYENSSSTEIPERYWASAIRNLKPIKVYTHRVNIVVAQKVRDNLEEGKYIYIPVSSYLPMDGVDGFAYKPNPKKANRYHLEDGVFDYKRTLTN